MGACYYEIALERDESNASCRRCGFPESSPWNTKGSGSFGCKYNFWVLADVSLWNSVGCMHIYIYIFVKLSLRSIPSSFDCYFLSWNCFSEPNLRPSFAELTVALKPLQRLAVPSNVDQPSSPLPQEISVNPTQVWIKWYSTCKWLEYIL